MQFKKVFSVLAVVSVLIIAGCHTGGAKQTHGTYLGAIGGGLLGAQFGGGSGRVAMAAIGTFIGSQVGAAMGKKMDENDKRIASSTATRALEHHPDNRVSRWQNPNTKNSGEFVVTRTVENTNKHQVCRDYVHTVNIDGRQERLHGKACRDIRDNQAYWHVQ